MEENLVSHFEIDPLMWVNLPLNFKLGEPTVNGRIYPKEVFEKALDKKVNEALYLYNDYQRNHELSDALGIVKNYKEENGNFIIGVDLFENGFFIEELLKEKGIFVTTAGIAIFTDGDIEIKDDYELSFVYLTTDNAFDLHG